MNLQEALQDYLHYIQAVDQKSLATIHSYTQDLQEYLSWLQMQGKTEMEDILPRISKAFYLIWSRGTYRRTACAISAAVSIIC